MSDFDALNTIPSATETNPNNITGEIVLSSMILEWFYSKKKNITVV